MIEDDENRKNIRDLVNSETVKEARPQIEQCKLIMGVIEKLVERELGQEWLKRIKIYAKLSVDTAQGEMVLDFVKIAKEKFDV